MGKSLLGLLLLAAFLTAGVAAVSVFFLQSQTFNKVQVAVVIPREETLVKQVADLASAMESVESICQLHYLSEEEAWKGLETGELQAVIRIPENFYADIYSGVNTPVELWLSTDSGLNTQIFCELLSQAVSLLQHSEAGVYAALSVERQEEARMGRDAMGDFLAKEYALELLKRDRLFAGNVLSAMGELKTEEYYLITALLLILLVGGLLFGFLYRAENRALKDKLSLYGLGPKKIALVKILTMAAILWIIAGIFYLSAWGILRLAGQQWLPFRLQVIPGLGLVSLALGAWFHLLFSLGGKSMQSTVMILGINLLMIICCGLLLPSAYLPSGWEKLGRILPLYHWNLYLQRLIFVSDSWKQGLIVLAGTAVCTGLGTIVYEKIR